MKDQEAEYEVLDTRTETAPAVGPLEGAGWLNEENVRKAEESVPLHKRIKIAALGATNENDWRFMGPNAYLQKSGCEKVAALFGISFLELTISPPETRTKESGEIVTTFTAYCTAELRGRRTRQMGVADSDKQFYAGAGDGEVKPYDERDFSSMKKHALTNAMNRALKMILGLNGLTRSEVEAAVGKDVTSRVGAHSYQGKGKPAETVADQDLKAKIREMVLDMASGDEEEAKKLLRRYSGFKGKDGGEVSVSSVNDAKFSAKWAASTYGKVKADYEKGGFGGPPAAEAPAQREPGDD